MKVVRTWSKKGKVPVELVAKHFGDDPKQDWVMEKMIMTDPEITTTTWKTKALNVCTQFYAWAKLHPGIMIPAAAYLVGVATPSVVRWMVT